MLYVLKLLAPPSWKCVNNGFGQLKLEAREALGIILWQNVFIPRKSMLNGIFCGLEILCTKWKCKIFRMQQKLVLKGKLVALNTCIRKKEISKNQSSFSTLETWKKEQSKSKVSRKKEIIKNRAEINQIRNRKIMDKLNKNKIWLFEKINKINKILASLTKEKRAKTNYKYQKQVRGYHNWSHGHLKIIKKYYENVMLTWMKWTNFLKTQSIKFTQEELDDLSWLISIKGIDLIIYEPKTLFFFPYSFLIYWRIYYSHFHLCLITSEHSLSIPDTERTDEITGEE